MKKYLMRIAGAAALSFALAASATAKDFYKMSTLGPGSGPYVVMSTFAKIANQNVADQEIQVNATGAATRHALDAARGKIDFFMSAPSVHFYMMNKIAMYQQTEEAPELSKNLRGIFNFPIGVYHFLVYDDSGINSYADMKGKKIFTGPPTGAAKVTAEAILEGASGYKAKEDYTAVNLGWGPAGQAFQDHQLDVYINSTNAPSPVISQIVLTNKVRMFGLSDKDFESEAIKKTMKVPGRTIETIYPRKLYGDNMMTEGPIKVIGAWAGLGTRKDMPEQIVYEMTKAFWENIADMHAVAEWAKAITLDKTLSEMNMPLHPGAAKYYKEKGLTIPAKLMAN